MEQVRDCGSGRFNTGHSRCPLVPEYIRAIILAERGVKLPTKITLEELEKALHADRPGRLYGVKNVVEFAPNGGEVQTSNTGYGSTEVSGYSAYTAAFTMEKFDAGFRANILRIKNTPMQVWYVDKNNVIWGENDADGSLKGFDLSGVYISGQDNSASGTRANNVLNLMYTDVEKSWMYPKQVSPLFAVVSAIEGLRFVDVVKKDGAANEYYVCDYYDRLNVGQYFSDSLAEIACWKGASAVEYVAASQLQANGVTGIEQWA